MVRPGGRQAQLSNLIDRVASAARTNIEHEQKAAKGLGFAPTEAWLAGLFRPQGSGRGGRHQVAWPGDFGEPAPPGVPGKDHRLAIVRRPYVVAGLTGRQGVGAAAPD